MKKLNIYRRTFWRSKRVRCPEPPPMRAVWPSQARQVSSSEKATEGKLKHIGVSQLPIITVQLQVQASPCEHSLVGQHLRVCVWSSRWGCYLENKFCKQFSESSPCLPRQQGSSSTTVEISENCFSKPLLQLTAPHVHNKHNSNKSYNKTMFTG